MQLVQDRDGGPDRREWDAAVNVEERRLQPKDDECQSIRASLRDLKHAPFLSLILFHRQNLAKFSPPAFLPPEGRKNDQIQELL